MGNRGKSTHDQDEDPAWQSDLGPDGKPVDEGDEVEEHKGGDGRLVVQELHAGHVELAVVAPDPDSVQGRGEDAGKGKDDPQQGRGLDRGIGGRARVVVGNDTNAGAGGDQGQDGPEGQGGAVEDEVHEGDGRGEEDTGDLVKGDGREGEGEVGEHHIQTHGDGQGDEVLDAGTPRGEEGEAGPREYVESEPGDEEVEGREGELDEFQAGVGKDGLVGEDLGTKGHAVSSEDQGGKSRKKGNRGGSHRTMPTVATVLTIIQIRADLKWLFGFSLCSVFPGSSLVRSFTSSSSSWQASKSQARFSRGKSSSSSSSRGSLLSRASRSSKLPVAVAEEANDGTRDMVCRCGCSSDMIRL